MNIRFTETNHSWHILSSVHSGRLVFLIERDISTCLQKVNLFHLIPIIFSSNCCTISNQSSQITRVSIETSSNLANLCARRNRTRFTWSVFKLKLYLNYSLLFERLFQSIWNNYWDRINENRTLLYCDETATGKWNTMQAEKARNRFYQIAASMNTSADFCIVCLRINSSSRTDMF